MTRQKRDQGLEINLRENHVPSVSVVIPTYNRATTLPRAIKSVLSQDYTDLELIIVDDASSDDTAEVLSRFEDPRLRVILHDHNKGFAGALNTGGYAARGDVIAFQDSDDEWLHGKLSRQMQELSAAPDDCVCVYCIKIVYGRDPDYVRGKRRIVCVPGPEIEEVSGDMRLALARTNFVSTQTIVCRKDAFLRAKGFDERLYNSVDWDFASRLATLGSFAFVDEPLVNTYIQKDSISTLSRKAPYSQLIISNKLKRSGIPATVQADRWARLGITMGRLGYPRRGETLIRASLAARPLVAKSWGRLFLNRLKRFRSTH
ncbi:glycosyltransferase [Roseovarius spongiae]|uniref:Glycosyltransferase n=1 Tax=Roseovarius spongiae TaxID=2320272 RepID=A0A3A8AU50_9RHOB|nr:glycosyltransferase family 2 protein [Roseovarius spongiae]RKF12369.1 glycosyltransferase [Roseovarius spongiae]